MVLIGGKKDYWIEKSGRVVGPTFMTVPQKKDKAGFRYVDIQGDKVYIHDAVLRSYGEPPAKSRPAEKGEVVNFIDNDKDNTFIDNLEWIKEEDLIKKKGSQKKLGEEGEELVWSLIKSGKTYKQIKAHFANNEGIKIYDTHISEIKKKYTAQE